MQQLILDGNARWATRQGLPAFVGHERGVAALKSAVITAREWGIPALTVYAFSTENWQRAADEVAFLMDLFHSALQQQLPELQANGVRLLFIGQLHRLPTSLQQQVAACEAATAANTGLLMTVAVSYSAQEDIAAAVQQLAHKVAAGQLNPAEVSEGVTGGSSHINVLCRLFNRQLSLNLLAARTTHHGAVCCPPPCADNSVAHLQPPVYSRRHSSSGSARLVHTHQRGAAAEQLHAV